MNDYESIEAHIQAATSIALKLLEERARSILRRHRNLDEFIMGMGIATFTQKSSEDSIDPSERAYLKPVCDLLEEFDSYLHLTGHAVRFRANDPVITDW